MSAQPARGAPAVVRSTSLDFAHHRSFLADVVIDKGPRTLLGRLMLKVDTDLREKGVVVSFATLLERADLRDEENWWTGDSTTDFEGLLGLAIDADEIGGPVACRFGTGL